MIEANEFSDTQAIDDPCLPCDEGNLFFADMTQETQNRLQFSASVNGKATPVLPVMEQYKLERSAPQTINELRFSIGNQSHTVIPDLAEYQVGEPEELKVGLAVETEEIGSLPPAPFYPRGALAAAQYAKWRFMNEGEIGALRETSLSDWVALDQAHHDMGFQPHFGENPLFHTSDLIRYSGELDRRLNNVLNKNQLSPRAAAILTERTERYRAIVQNEINRRENGKGEGVFAIALAENCPASGMPDGNYSLTQVTPEQEVSLAACISMAFEVAWVEYLEQVRAPENLNTSFRTAQQAGFQGAAAAAVTVEALGAKFIADLNASYIASRSSRTVNRLLERPPTLREWAAMLRGFWREIVNSNFEIRISPRGKKTVIFSGKATLRAHLTRARYAGDELRVIDYAVKGQAPSWRGAAAAALRGGVNRAFIAVGGIIEIKAWLDSEKEDWADLIVRLGLVIVTAVITAIVSVLIVASAPVAMTGLALALAIAGVSILVGMFVAFVFEFFRIREGLAGLLRFTGRYLISALKTVWGWIRSAWTSANANQATVTAP